MKTLLSLLVLVTLTSWSFAQDSLTDPAREQEMRLRYESVLFRNPFQERAFNSVYEGYAKVEGVDKWIEALTPKSKEGDDQLAALLLLGQIYDRQFKTAEAIAAFEQAAVKGEARPQFKVLLGTLYYKAGKDEPAVKLLGEALDTLTDLDQRASVSRLLGNLYLRQGKREQAVAVWKRIAEQNPGEVFAQLELAEIYEDNRMWDQAIEVYRGVAERSKDDPYRRCRALRSIGQCYVQAEKFKDAIATYEQALELVAPGNWLFEDLKLRLVGVYEDIGDLAGLVKYVEARLQQNPGDTEFRDLLAETLTRMAKFDDAEQQYRQMIERNPRNSSIYEKLIALHLRTGKKAEVTAAFEKLIELFPTDNEYLRRLGEFYLRDTQPDKAKETWRRLVRDNAGPEKLATLAGWFESYEFADEAVATYQQALEKKKDKDWTERLAALKFQKGEEAEAVRLWLSLITDQSKPEDYAEVASILESNNKHDEALTLRKQVVVKAPENLEGRLAYAKVLMKKQQFETAAAEFELLAAQDKNEFLMQQGEQGRADAWRELGILEEKQKQIETEVTANPADARKLGQLARLYERAGQREKAIALYEGRRETEPDNLEHLRALANLYRAAKQTEQAITAYKTLLDKDKVRARVYQKELLDIYLVVDLKDEAIAAGEALVSLAPADPEVHLMLAQVYQTYRQPEKAFGEYRASLRLEANEPDYHRQYGEALEQDKRYGDAQDSFRKMLDTAKEDSTRLAAVSALARIHMQQDRLAELVNEFQRRIRNTPKKLSAYEELAAIYKESGQIVRSVEILESGLNTIDDKGAALKSLIRVTFEAQDFPKVKSYFEQLVSMSGKPTSNEFEKLGQIYAQLGEIEKARQTWNRIVSEAPKDPKAHDRLAQILRDAGFMDEAIAMKARAVELDPVDYKRRFDYAQMLGQSEQPVEALKQLSLILDLGDAEQAKEEKQSEKKVKPVQRGPQGGGPVQAYQFAYGMRNYSGYYGGGWQGSFKQFRPQILMFTANVAQQSIGEDAFVEQFRERLKKSQGSADAQRDLLTVLQMYNRVEDALKVAFELLERVPNDVDLLQQTALYFQNQQQLDKAIPLLERLAKAQPKYRLQALQGLVPLYFQNKQEDKALELADQLLKENPSDMNTIWAMGSFLQQNGKLDRARAIYARAMEIDPQMKPNLLMNIAQIAMQENKPDEARKLYTELLTADFGRTRYAWMGPRRQMNLYIPQPAMGQAGMMGRYYGGGGPMGRMPPNVFGNIDYTKQNAVQQLKMLSKGTGAGAATNDFTVELEKTARGYKAAVSAGDRNKAWDTAKLLCAYYLGDKQPEKALDLLKAMREAGYEEMEWFNIAIYLAEQKEDYDKMAAFYDEVQQRFPAKSRDVAQAKAMTFVKAKKYDDTAKVVREMNQQRVPPAQILSMITALRTAGEKKTARALLEEHLAGVSRNPDALQQLAQLYGEENEFEKAVELATEAWERKAHGRSSQGYFYGPSYYSYGGNPGGPDSLLGDLHRYYVAQGKSEELIARFKQRLEKQPSSVQAYENLAQIYVMGANRQAALELYQQLSEKRPHLHQIRRQIAQLYTEMGDTKKATQYYEDLIKANPMAYEQFQWELRWLYQRMGKGKELAQMEQKVVDKARDPNQIRQVADRFNEEGEYDKAAELYRKAIKMSPGDPWIKNQLAQVFVNMGNLDEAVTLYKEWMDSPQLRGQGWVDHQTMRNLVGLFRATGRLQELKDRCDGELKKNPNDRSAMALKTHIAVIEKRFADSTAGFKSLMDGMRDPNGMWQIMDLAEITGDTGPVFEMIEKADPNNLDQNRLARFYLAKGDKEKAEDMIQRNVDRQMGFGNGGWVLREGLSQLCEFEMWEAAEKFIRKYRDTPLQQWEQQEFDGVIAEQYIKDNRFSAIVEEVLKKESFKGRDLELFKTILQRYQWQNQPARRREFLEKVCAADPKNRELGFQLAELYDVQRDGGKKLAILNRLASEEPANQQYQEAQGRCLLGMGRAAEAVDGLKKWVTEKPLEARWASLSRIQGEAGQLVEARVSLVKAVEAADPSRKDELNLRLAEFDASQGDLEAPKKAHREIFEKKKDQNSFHGCLTFLQNQGFDHEAHEFFLANKDGGFLEQYRGQEIFALCLNESDYTSPLDLSWQFTRYGERWNRDQFFNQVAKLFSDRGKFPLVLADLQLRIAAETNRNQLLQQKLAEAWTRAGQPEKARGIYDEMIKVSPFNRAAISAKAQLLVKLGRDDDALALLREMKGVQSLTDEIDAKFQLIELLARLGRTAEAEQELETLLAWAKGASGLERAANVYRDLQKWAKAAELFEQCRKVARNWNYGQLLFNLGQCYAKLGRYDEALKAWESGGGSRYSGNLYDDERVTGWLLGEGLNELALKFAQSRLENVGAYVTLARAQVGLGKTNDAFAAFERGAQALKPEQQGELRNRLGQFITEYALESAAAAQDERSPTPLLTGALINLFAGSDENSARAKRLAAHVEKLSSDDPELQLALGGAWLKSRHFPEAAAQFRKALASTNETQRLAAARFLTEAGFAADALPVLADLMKTRPNVFVNDPGLVAAAAKTRDAALIAKLSETLAASALHETQNEFYATVIAHHRGQTNEARAKLTALAAAPKLGTAQLQALAALCADQGLVSERAAYLKRLASGGHPGETRGWAMSELVKMSAKAGDFQQAVQVLAGMQVSWGMESAADTREALADAVTSENFAAFKDAVLAAVRDHSGSDMVSNLIGLCAQIAQRVGKTESAARLAAEAKLTELEREESAAWDDLIEQWEVAGPFRGQATEPGAPIEYNQFGQQTFRTPPRAPEPVPAPNLAWKKTDPKHELGTIRLAPLLGLNTIESQGQFAYARTTMSSPEDRIVTFALGSDDTVAVWVNGEQVNISNEPRSLHPDQDRFNVRLKKGENRVFLKIGNFTDAWGFCLRVLSGREGLTLVQRSAP